MARRIVMTAVLVAVAGCAAQPGRPAPQPPAPARDPRTAAALLKIATVFNNNYDSGVYGPV